MKMDNSDLPNTNDDDDFDVDAYIEKYLIAHDTYYTLKCINCNREEKIPDFVYDEEADFKKEPAFLCNTCNTYSMYLKRIALEKINTKKSNSK